MSYDPRDYPEDWPAIAQRVKRAAHGRCENCGRDHSPVDGYCLTVHHLDGLKGNCDWRNLAALDQRCHLSIQGRYQPGQTFLPGIPPPDWLAVRGLIPGLPADPLWLWSTVRAGADWRCDGCTRPEPAALEHALLVIHIDGDRDNWGVSNMAALCDRCLAAPPATLSEPFSGERGRAPAGRERYMLRSSLELLAAGPFGTAGAGDPRTAGLQPRGTLRETPPPASQGYFWDT